MRERSIPLDAIVERLRRSGLAPEWIGTAPRGPTRVREVATDSRRVGAGTLFCALGGSREDGHRYLPEAARRGAVAALVEREAASLSLPQLRVADGRRAAAHAAAEFFGDPWDGLALVGVTGTNGKTTTAAILRHLLVSRGPAASIGTLGVVGADGVVPGTEGLTTPGPTEVARWLRRLLDEGVRGVAMEVSSHALHQSRVAAVAFDAAVFTNLSRDHLDYHGTFEEYRQAKLGLLERIRPGGVAALNVEDPAWAGLEAPRVRVVRFGASEDAEVTAEGVRPGERGMEWTLRTPDGSAGVRLPLLGTFNVANALGAAAALWGLGWGAAEIAERLSTLPQVPGRLERVAGPPRSATVLVDYAHTPDALERALRALRPLVRGRLLVVFGAGGDRDRGKRPQMGRVAAAEADFSVVTSDNPRTEDPERIVKEIEGGMGDAPRARIVDRAEAIWHALEITGPDDLVLLAGKGHESYQIIGTERRPFDERVLVGKMLAERERCA